MPRLGYHLLLLLLVLALVAGGRPVAVLAASTAGGSCMHEQQDVPAAGHGSHDRDSAKPQQEPGAVCLCCAIGACTAVSGLPAGPVITASIAASPIYYWRVGAELAERSIRPDSKPPRRTA